MSYFKLNAILSRKYRMILYDLGQFSALAGMQTWWKDRKQINSSLLAFLLPLEKGKGFWKKVCFFACVQSHLSCRQLLKRVDEDVIFIVKFSFLFLPASLTYIFSSLSYAFILSLSLSLHIDLLISVLFCQDHMSEGTLSLAVRPPDSRLLDDNSAVIQGVFSLSRCLSAWQLLSAGAESCKNLLQCSFFSSCSLSQRGCEQTHSHTWSLFHKVREQF